MRRQWILIGQSILKTIRTIGDKKCPSRGGRNRTRTCAKSRPVTAGTVINGLRNKWFSGAGGPSQVTESITYKGLFPIVVASCVWGQQWFRQHVLFRSDKEAVVFILTLRTSKFPSLIQLLCKLLFSAAQFNFMFTAQQSCPGRS